MTVRVNHLFEHPERIPLVAGWIYEEFWRDRPGARVEPFEGLLRHARDPDRIPLSLLSLVDATPAGTVNLVHTDSETRPDLHPWLAALYVLPEFRRLGIGSALVREIVGHAARLGVPEVFLGTDIPAFYARLGAERFQPVRGELCIMRVRITPPADHARGGRQ